MGAEGGLRRPAVAGLFYAGDRSGLRAQIEECFMHPLGPGSMPSPTQNAAPVKGLLSPHAGYLYSGPIAAHAFHRLASRRPRVVIVVGPNHHGIGAPVSISNDRAWWTPLGEVGVDREVSEALVSLCPYASLDGLAHKHEHSVEVQIPFLQYLYGESLSLVAISMATHEWEISKALGEAIGQLAAERSAVIIASSDLTHYELHEMALEKDALALEALLSLDPARFYDVVMRQDLSICGPGPVMVMAHACLCMGATEAELLKHATSGDVAGDRRRVVGYASVALA